MRRLISFGITCVLAVAARATHITGGELSYTALGGDQYEVTLKMYRDCGPNNTNGTDLDATAEIGVFDANGDYLFSSTFTLIDEVDVPVTLGTPCLTPPSSICIQEGRYVGTIDLPSGTGGYTLTYQRCCRSPIVINLNGPQTQGVTCTVHVPDPQDVGDNSSPHFNAYPPIALCLGQAISFDGSATDADGDVLEYDLCAPYQGADQFNPLPSPPAAPPYLPVVWGFTYSVNNMIDASPGLAIDPVTGQVTLTPTLQGSFCIGIRVKEFRGGVELSEVIRDFRFDVVPCEQQFVSSITPQADLVAGGSEHTGICDGLTVDMENESAGAGAYHWDFGVPGVLNDTSAEVSPSFTFPAAGIYTVTLIAQPGWPCADTATSVFHVAPPVTVQFTPPPITCFDEQPLALQAQGQFTPAAAVVWQLGPGTAPDTAMHLAHATFPTNGAFAVTVTATENGCTDSYTDSVRIAPRPVPLFKADTAGCIPYKAQFTDSSRAWTHMTYAWEFGDGGTSTERDPMHTYTTEGYFTVKLTVSTDSGCIATESLVRPALVQVWPQPHAAFAVDPPVASLMDPEIAVDDLSEGTYHWDYELNGAHFDTTHFTYVFDDAGWYRVRLTATSGFGCSDTTSVPVFVGGHFFYAPTAFTPNDDDRNEVWLPVVHGARQYHLAVYDRWGNTVFSTTDPKEGWNGAAYPIGTYAYKAWLSEWGPLEKEYNGSFILLR